MQVPDNSWLALNPLAMGTETSVFPWQILGLQSACFPVNPVQQKTRAQPGFFVGRSGRGSLDHGHEVSRMHNHRLPRDLDQVIPGTAPAWHQDPPHSILEPWSYR